MQQGQYSPDGRWWWDGASWRPVAPPGGPPTGGRPGLFWFFSAPGWAGPFFLTGLILFLPVVGQMVLLGWYLAARDTLRSGWRLVPPAGFQHLERGVAPWVASLVYGLYLLPVYLLLGAGLVVAAVNQSGAAIALLAVVLGLFWLASTVTVGFLSGALFDVADAEGIGAAIDPRRVWAAATADARTSWRVFGALVLGGFVYLAVAVPISFFVPFGALILTLGVPGIYLMAAPAQADLDRDRAAMSG